MLNRICGLEQLDYKRVGTYIAAALSPVDLARLLNISLIQKAWEWRIREITPEVAIFHWMLLRAS